MNQAQNSSDKVRVRFAPSPTGFLHIGGVRTALFNWLYARHHQGKFLLRIEDTDTERSKEQFTNDILSTLKWLGLNWDEDLVYQSQRKEVHLEKAHWLLDQEFAYRCYCTEKDLEKMREKAIKEGRNSHYDRRCRNLDEEKTGVPFVIRAKLPLEGSIEFDDLIRGKISVDYSELDDFILVRSNGVPTYNLAVVVDDIDADITHLIRGDDHINNTPKQVQIYRFLNASQPKFAHLPMILGSDKKKLSKRHGDVSASVYRGEGYLPEGLLNFLARLGWSHGDQEVFSVEEMVQYFDFDHVQKSSAVFNKEKLEWVNAEHIKTKPAQDIINILEEDFSDHFSTPALNRLKTDLGKQFVEMVKPKMKRVVDFAEQLVPLCTPGVIEVDPSSLKWNKKGEDYKKVVKTAVEHVKNELSDKVKAFGLSESKVNQEECWGKTPCLSDLKMGHDDFSEILKQISAEHGIKLGDLAPPMRLVITGKSTSAAGLFDLVPVLPWDLVEQRLSKLSEL